MLFNDTPRVEADPDREPRLAMRSGCSSSPDFGFLLACAICVLVRRHRSAGAAGLPACRGHAGTTRRLESRREHPRRAGDAWRSHPIYAAARSLPAGEEHQPDSILDDARRLRLWSGGALAQFCDGSCRRSTAPGPKSGSWRRFVQALIFTPPLILTIDALELPLAAFRNWIFLKYGLSVQGWGSWFWDWIKNESSSRRSSPRSSCGFCVAIIRRSRRRWWFYFWLASLPIGLVLVFLQPLVIDPLFFKFEPLAQKEPALTASLEQMVQRAGEDIPPQRMFWMGAREKLTYINAYVSGFAPRNGSSCGTRQSRRCPRRRLCSSWATKWGTSCSGTSPSSSA